MSIYGSTHLVSPSSHAAQATSSSLGSAPAPASGASRGAAPCAPLHTLLPGQSATIDSVRATGELGRRLHDMGLFLGVRLTLVGPAPLGDPIAVALDGYDLSLRRAEAEHIMVRPLQSHKAASKE